MKSPLKQSIVVSFFALSAVAFAGQPPQRGGNQGQGGGAPQQTVDPRYTVEVSLSRLPRNPERNEGLGSLQVIDNSTGRVIKTCKAVGGIENHPDGESSRRTPPGEHRVYEAYAHLKYQGRWLEGVNATYFESIMGNPVAIHAGNLNSNSHACVRTDCSAYIKQLAESVATPVGGRSPIIPGAAKRRFGMVVNVSYQ